MFGRLYIVDVLDGGADYRFRLFGAFWHTVYGRNLTGARLSEIEASGNLLALRPHYDECVAKRSLAFKPGRLVWPNKQVIAFQRLLIPFSKDSYGVSMLLCGAYCEIPYEDICLFQGAGVPQLVLDESVGTGSQSEQPQTESVARAEVGPPSTH
jgi:hypothetical protein